MKFGKLIDFFAIISIVALIFQPMVGMKIYYVIVGVMITFTTIDIVKRNKLKLNYYELLFVLFIIFCFISKIYAISQPTANYTIKELVMSFTISFFIVDYTQRNRKCEDYEQRYLKLLDVFTFATTILSVYLLIFELPKVIGTRDRLGRQLFESYGTYMIISYDLIISICYLLWKIVYKKSKLLPYTYVAIIILIIVACFSGTRKTLICPIIFMTILLFYKYRKNFISILKFSILGLIIVSFMYNIITNNENLYKIIGSRIENMVSTFFAKENESIEEDASIQERQLLKKLAIAAFYEKPLLGWGVNNFANYSEMHSGPFLYAHCNYLELLSSVGIIGTILYYTGYLYIVYKAFKRLKANDMFAIYILSFMIMNLVSDYTTVSYSKIQYILIYIIFAKYLNESRLEREIVVDETNR